MTVSLKLYQKGDGQPQLLRERSFEMPRITIGRDAECAIALEDPKKWVSRVHAEINVEGGACWLSVASKVNPVFVNGERHLPGSRLQLQVGDRFEIGEYEIELAPQPPPPPVVEPAEPTFIGQQVYMPDIVLDSGPEPAAAAPAAEPVTEPVTVPIQPKPVQAAPADDGVFAEATFMGAKPPAGVFDEPTFIGKRAPEEKEESVEDSVFREVTQLRNLPPPEDVFLDPPEKLDVKVDAAPTTAAAEVPFEERSVFMEQTQLRASLSAADVTLPNPGETQDAVRAAQGLEQALAAFFEGAGLPRREFASAEEMELFLRQCGAIVRASVEGVMALLVARAEAKKEFRAEDRTMVASRDNNPLKLMAEPQEAMDFLFDTKERSGGFLTPVQAVGDAFEDMRAHEAALIAGMRAAILGSLKRFDPKTLEEELGKAAGGLGMNKKAKLWDLFSAYQQKLARDAEDDFNKVFGRDFMGSYMAQVRQLKKK